jgi:EpsD family peptidyl-prolyl cis-trans isomerase
MPIRRCINLALPVIAVVMITSLSGCNSNNEKKPLSQVAAKVNAEEISVHQINYVLSHTNTTAISPEQAPQLRREILDKLIEQQLAIEQALANKLDHSPEVVIAIEAGRREILARAYLGKIAADQGKTTPDEAKQYIAEHPQLFAERRIFTIQEIILPASANLTPTLRQMLNSGKSMTEIGDWLKGQNIKFAAGSARRAAEQIPLELLPGLHSLKDGQSLIVENTDNVTLMRLVASRTEPVSVATALPAVAQFLAKQRANQAIASNVKQLKAAAKISYEGEFAQNGSTPPVAKTMPAKPDLAEKQTSASLEKGIAGLK